MASKAQFTEPEWQTLEWAVADTMAYLSMADPGVWDMFKEAKGAAKYISGVKTSDDDVLVRQLAGDIHAKRDKALSGNPTDVAGEVVARVTEAWEIVTAKAPEDLAAFRSFILGVAQATAEAAKGVGPTETAAIAKLEAAMA